MTAESRPDTRDEAAQLVALCENRDKWMTRAQAAETFLERAAVSSRPRQMIVSTRVMTVEGIAQARAEGRMFMMLNGLRFALCPLEVDTGEKAPPPFTLTPSADVDKMRQLVSTFGHYRSIGDDPSAGGVFADIGIALDKIQAATSAPSHALPPTDPSGGEPVLPHALSLAAGIAADELQRIADANKRDGWHNSYAEETVVPLLRKCAKALSRQVSAIAATTPPCKHWYLDCTQPVAWRYRLPNGTRWSLTDDSSGLLTQGWDVEPLYLHQAPSKT